MPRKKLYEEKISEESFRVKPLLKTVDYIKSQMKITGHKAHQIIRDMLDTAHNYELSAAQFAGGTTKIFQSVMTKLIREIIGEPLERNTEEIKLLKQVIEKNQTSIDEFNRRLEAQEKVSDEYLENATFRFQEAQKMNRFLYSEIQILNTYSHEQAKAGNIKFDVAKERNKLRDKFDADLKEREETYRRLKKIKIDL